MKIKINGNEEILEKPLSLAELAARKNVSPEKAVIEHNLRIVGKEEWPKIILRENDNVEIVSFLGGGEKWTTY